MAPKKWVKRINRREEKENKDDDGDNYISFFPADAIDQLDIENKCLCGEHEEEESNCFSITADFTFDYQSEILQAENCLLGCGYRSERAAQEVVEDLLIRIQNSDSKETIIEARRPK